MLSFSCDSLSGQFQIVFFDPADLPEKQTKQIRQNCRQHKADERHRQPVHTGNRRFRTRFDIGKPAGVHPNLADKSAGAHAGRHRAPFIVNLNTASGNRSGNHRGEDRRKSRCADS